MSIEPSGEVSLVVWGVDVAVAHLAVAAACEDGRVPAFSLSMRTKAKEGERLAFIFETVRDYAREVSRGVYAPTAIWVEQPSGRTVHPQLWYATGVIQAALFEATSVPVWSIPPSAWKRGTVGKGNASKVEVAEWAAGVGYEFASEHEADAIGIAVAGRAMVVEGKWDTASRPSR